MCLETMALARIGGSKMVFQEIYCDFTNGYKPYQTTALPVVVVSLNVVSAKLKYLKLFILADFIVRN